MGGFAIGWNARGRKCDLKTLDGTGVRTKGMALKIVSHEL